MFRDGLLSQEVPTLSSSTSSSSISSPSGFDSNIFQASINNLAQRQNSNLAITIDPSNPNYVLLEKHEKTRISVPDITRLLAAIGINSLDDIPQLKQTIANQQEEIDLLKLKLQQYEKNVADHLRQIYLRLGIPLSSSYPEHHFTQDTTDFTAYVNENGISARTTSPYLTTTTAHLSAQGNLPAFDLVQQATDSAQAGYPHAMPTSSPSRFFSTSHPTPSTQSGTSPPKNKKRKHQTTTNTASIPSTNKLPTP